MSALTEEQRKRIEENRRKALEKRALKAEINNKQNSIVPVNKTAGNIGVSNNTVVNTSNNVASALQFTKPPSLYSAPKTFNNSKTVNNSSKSSEMMKGQCVLLSRKRFYIDIGYHKEVIEIFKSVPGRLYDMQTKKWNFPIDDHDKLVSLLKPLQPNVLIIPLPRPIVKLLMAVDEKKVIKEYDLSSMDPNLVKSLLPFQKIGLYFGIQHRGKVLIADDMGLGKTIQGIAIANYFKEDWPLLVVTPSSMRYSWLESFHTWLPSLGTHEISVINSSKDHIPNDKVIIMSYDLLTRMQDTILKRCFKSVIFDESHFLKNHKTARTKSAQAIIKNMNRIIMLSGTPALSRPIELLTQLSALCPNYFSSHIDYGMRYCNGKKMAWGWDFSGSSNMGELQILLEELVMIRRLKSEVIQQLPAKCRQMIVLDPSRISAKSKVMRAMYQKMHQAELRGMERRGALLEYFHETGAVKIPAVCEYIEDLLESDRKFLCFAHHQNVMDSISKCIEKKKVDYIRIDGSVSAEQRKRLCDHFQFSDSCKVAVLSITSANCGITLTAASLVIFAELFWNPGILTQAEDRAHRIGQEDSVVIQYLVAKGTADDEIWPLVQRKLDTLNKAGLSKDNFKSADTVIKKDSTQPQLEDFWNDLESSVDANIESFTDIPEKRLKLDFDI